MVGTYLTAALILFVIFYCIIGTILSIKLSKEINYKRSFLTLWNVIQLEVIFKKESGFQLDGEESKRQYIRLSRAILLFYYLFIPMIFLIFVVDIAEL